MMRGVLLLLVLASPAPAQQLAISPHWSAEKCARYSRAWAYVSAGPGLAGIGPEFLAAHAEFLTSDCRIRGNVCPRTPAELALADTLTLMSVAEGTAGSFLPFHCDIPAE